MSTSSLARLASLNRNSQNIVTDLLGLTNYSGQSDAYDNAQNTLKSLINSNNETYDSIISQLNNQANALGGSDTLSNYADAVSSFNSGDYTTDLSSLSNYNFDKSISDYLDPNADYVINQATNAAQNSLAGQGNLYSGGAGQQLQAVASEKAADLYKDAKEQYNTEKNFDYNNVKDVVSAEQDNNSTALSADTSNISALSGLADKYQTTQDSSLSAMLSQLQNNSELQQAIAQMGIDSSSQPTLLGSLLGGF